MQEYSESKVSELKAEIANWSANKNIYELISPDFDLCLMTQSLLKETGSLELAIQFRETLVAALKRCRATNAPINDERWKALADAATHLGFFIHKLESTQEKNSINQNDVVSTSLKYT